MELDAQTMASWNIDYLKLDGCYSKVEDMKNGKMKVFSEKMPPKFIYLTQKIYEGVAYVETCKDC